LRPDLGHLMAGRRTSDGWIMADGSALQASPRSSAMRPIVDPVKRHARGSAGARDGGPYGPMLAERLKGVAEK